MTETRGVIQEGTSIFLPPNTRLSEQVGWSSAAPIPTGWLVTELGGFGKAALIHLVGLLVLIFDRKTGETTAE